MKLGYSTWGMPQLAIDDAVAQVAHLGYDGIEITVAPGWRTELTTLDAGERRRIPALLTQHGLVLSAIGHATVMEPDPAQRESNRRWIEGIVDLAAAWAAAGPPVVNVLSGGRTADWETQRAWIAERLGEAAAYAQRRGVTLALEPHVDLLIDTPDRALEMLRQVGSPALRINFDISHFDVLGMTIEESVAALAPYTVHTHVKDQRGRHPNHQFLTPGEGDFDYVAYLAAMRAHGYDGFITAEISLMRQRRPDYDPLAAAKLAYTTLARAFDDAGIRRR